MLQYFYINIKFIDNIKSIISIFLWHIIFHPFKVNYSYTSIVNLIILKLIILEMSNKIDCFILILLSKNLFLYKEIIV